MQCMTSTLLPRRAISTRQIMAKKKRDALKYFSDEKSKFAGLLKQAHLISNTVGKRNADTLRVISSWLYMRICVTAKTIAEILEPQEHDYGSSRYLDHASIAILSRGLIENVAVLLYVGDANISEDEWECRRSLIDIHDFTNRSAFLTKIKADAPREPPEETLKLLRQRLEDNAFFQTLPIKKRQKLLEGQEMFVDGRHATMLELGWGDDFTRGLYKYLSNQAHTLAMSFHRTAENELYKNDSAGSRVVAAFSLSFARRALGASALHMIDLFPDIELKFDQIILGALKTEYRTKDHVISE
jgi:hypothetical protein